MRHLIVLTFVFAIACKPEAKPTPETPQDAPKEVREETAKKGKEGVTPVSKPAPAHSSSIPATTNQILVDQKIPDVALQITAPTEGQVLQSGKYVKVEFDLKNYRTGREIGQHVHVILDNNPYIAHYDADKPLILKDVAPGTHTLRVFPARHYHLSLKEGPVFFQTTFHVEKKTKIGFDATKPYLTYSRPKGKYSAESAKSLLLDFYVTGTELGKTSKVIYGVNGKEKELTSWTPVLLEPLAPGEHTITLKLVDMDGKPIENGGYNNTTRKITVK